MLLGVERVSVGHSRPSSPPLSALEVLANETATVAPQRSVGEDRHSAIAARTIAYLSLGLASFRPHPAWMRPQYSTLLSLSYVALILHRVSHGYLLYPSVHRLHSFKSIPVSYWYHPKGLIPDTGIQYQTGINTG